MTSEKTKDAIFDEVYLAGLRSGDQKTTRHFENHFRPLIRLKVWGRIYWGQEETLIDDVMAAVIEGVRRYELREPLYLPRYVCEICTRLMNQNLRSRSAARDLRRHRRMVREQVLAF